MPTRTRSTLKTLGKPCVFAANAGRSGVQAALDVILPPTCRLCNLPVGSEQDFCVSCERNLTLSEPMMRSACRRCGRPRPKIVVPEGGSTPDPTADSEVAPCIQCQGEKLAFAMAVPLWSYQDRVCEAVVAAKYGHQSALGAALGRRLAVRLIATITADLPDLVTYVPSHFFRQFVRGGTGNEAIAESVFAGLRAKKRSVRYRTLLKMTRRIEKQAWLDNDQRRENVRGAFRLKKSYAFAKTLVDQHILLVDDVLTTGATANEVTRVLLEGGARRVTLAVVARAIRSQ